MSSDTYFDIRDPIQNPLNHRGYAGRTLIPGQIRTADAAAMAGEQVKPGVKVAKKAGAGTG